MKYDIIIGLEIHAEINTKSKMFCSCKNDPFNLPPNEAVCPICLGHPGTLPLANKEAIDKVVLLGLAMDCQINRVIKFDRKNYFYPDLPKGYQISQYDLPIAHDGFLEVNKQKIDITRIHLEEDTGKSNHPKGKNYSLINYNRSGVPLLELVTEPVIKDSITARIFCQTLQQILRYLKISEANMEKGEMRCEANVSLQNKNSWYRDGGQIKTIKKNKLNNKVELKNINSFKSLEKAISYEIKRQEGLLISGEEILPETRGYNEETGETFRQRIKESQSEYRYFPEPDILPVKISSKKIDEIKKELTELPHKKRARFINQYSLSPDMADIITENKDISDWSEMAISELREWVSSTGGSWKNQDKKLIKLMVNWLTSELFKFLNNDKISIKESKISPENFAELILLLGQEKISTPAGQKILKIMYEKGSDPSDVMDEENLEQKNDENDEELESIIKKIIDENSSQFKEYQEGKDPVLQFFIGKTMAEGKGRYNPKKIIEIIKKLKKEYEIK
jgi:aspartyl-tRNA(Asn)/glutamyl-tRNA(Gln) amidotransferase subunit B